MLVALGLTVYRWLPLDGVSGILGPLMFGNDTQWAQGYTDSGFRAARVGMTREEVYKFLGRPLDLSSDCGMVVEHWTVLDPSRVDCNLFVRDIWFQGDTVVKKVAEFSPD
jgi:hypothetical protein